MIPMVARSRAGIAAARLTLPAPVVLVPTMGALHEGHRALLRRGRQISGRKGSLVVSVFVNPLQFGPDADLDSYPRDLAADLEVCAQEGVALIFAPLTSQLYPAKQVIMVDPGPVGRELEGAFRPGFFDGVLTVVLKIVNLVRPDACVFGEKDAQQLYLVRRMVAELNLNIDIVAVPTMREPDGLAASSRNGYLSAGDRVTARSLSRALLAGCSRGRSGPRRRAGSGELGARYRRAGRPAAGRRLPGAGRSGDVRASRTGSLRTGGAARGWHGRKDQAD